MNCGRQYRDSIFRQYHRERCYFIYGPTTAKSFRATLTLSDLLQWQHADCGYNTIRLFLPGAPPLTLGVQVNYPERQQIRSMGGIHWPVSIGHCSSSFFALRAGNYYHSSSTSLCDDLLDSRHIVPTSITSTTFTISSMVSLRPAEPTL